MPKTNGEVAVKDTGGGNGDAATLPIVKSYAASNKLFLENFATAFTNMIQSCGRGASGTGYTPCSDLVEVLKTAPKATAKKARAA